MKLSEKLRDDAQCEEDEGLAARKDGWADEAAALEASQQDLRKMVRDMVAVSDEQHARIEELEANQRTGRDAENERLRQAFDAWGDDRDPDVGHLLGHLRDAMKPPRDAARQKLRDMGSPPTTVLAMMGPRGDNE